MDSVSQLVLGATVSVAVMGRRVPIWQAALVGGVSGTLPDLDVFLDHGDAIRNMTLHRTESHALLYLTLVSPLIAWLVADLFRPRVKWPAWWPAIWLALITHPLLDLMTVYGTQLGLPLTDYPYAIGSIYIVDPLYTLPLLIGLGVALWRRGDVGLRGNRLGLMLSTLYLVWSVAIQSVAGLQIKQALVRQGIPTDQILVTPTAFNTLVWRSVVMTPDRYGEVYWSLLSPRRPLQVVWRPRHPELFDALRGDWYAERVAWFSHGFYAMAEKNGQVTIADLRMGEGDTFTFTFGLGTPQQPDPQPQRLPSDRPDLRTIFQTLVERL
ncbi:hydrolase [Pantoea conspicua]|uniref:Hydrolase n=1 Tax=Pantoea conspicua TaxID=472705 RepID=A0A1X1BS49_9GAMM|nr:metal-dependent hydrolase [Pantoea conspicua]ORM51010.1 hydrolase [Pantoea conspicua]